MGIPASCGPFTLVVCEYCNVAFPVSIRRLPRGKQFCSLSCSTFSRHAKRGTWEERFWGNVRKSEECWTWTAAASGGYGRTYKDGRMVLAHRVSYELANGPIPDGLVIDHLCRNRRCVNPAHMEVVTHSVNILRGESMSAKNSRKTHCVHGHPFVAGNIVRGNNDSRRCRECKKATDAAYYRKCVAEGRGW